MRRRVYEHKNGLTDGFTKKYNVNKLVYFEHFVNIEHAITRDKQLKKWKRQWKNELVERKNPNWDNLYEDI